jgi:hypothetical protein
VGRNCRAYETYTSNLEFKRLKPNELAQSRDPFTTPPVGGGFPSASPAKTTERITAIKDALSIGALEVPSTPVAQTPAPPETDSGTKDLENYVWGANRRLVVTSYKTRLDGTWTVCWIILMPSFRPCRKP